MGITATSSGAVDTVNSNSTSLTTYRASISSSATEIITLGVPVNGVQTALVGGTVTAGNVLTITVYDAGLTGGQQSVSYTVVSGDTATTIATGSKTAITGNSSLSAIGVTATSSSTVVNIKSTSQNLTTYSGSISSGGTETLTLAPSTGVVMANYNNVNELVKQVPGGQSLFRD